MFQELRPREAGFVGFGGNQKGKIVGIGRIGTDSLPSIDNVLYVEGLKHNLLSISQLCDNGYDVIFTKTGCLVKSQKDGSIFFTAKRAQNIYKIDLSELAKQDVKCLMSVDDEQ